MSIKTFVGVLASTLDVGSINTYFLDKRPVVEKILKKLRPEGSVDGNRYKLASLEGGSGKSSDFNFQNHNWGDWSRGETGNGIVNFVSRTMSCSVAQAVKWLSDEKYLDIKEVKKVLQSQEGDPLVFPIPEDVREWDHVLETQVLKKDRGIIKNHWTYRDTDGTVLGYKYRVDDRRTSKELFTLSYRAESGWTKKTWQRKLLPPYGLEDLGNEDPTVRVLFVEGENARDKAKEIFGHRWKVLGYSGVTGADAIWLPDEEFWKDAEVVIWPDNDSAGRDAARKIQMKLETLENKVSEIRIVRVENFSGLPPKWDLADWTPECPLDPVAEIERAESVDTFEHITREWIYVSQQDHFYNLEDRSLVWTATSFDRTYSRFRTKEGGASQRFLSDLACAQASDLDFVPGEGPIIVASNGKRFLNEWYAPESYREAQRIAADEDITDELIAHNCRFFIEHLKRICGDELAEPERDISTGDIIPSSVDRPILDGFTYHFAESVRRPMDKRGWIPMLVSEENGTGKTYFRRMMAAVMGSTRADTITIKEFVGDYHDWADGLLFYELGEAKSQDSTEVYEELKKRHSYLPFSPTMLSDRTQNTQQLNIKTKAKKRQRDFLNGCITANDLFPLALANTSGQEGSDRRLLVLNPKTILTEKQSADLFDDELLNRPQWIGAYLMRFRPKHKWNNSWAPITHHKRLMMEKDRTRSENRSDKFELGRFDKFYHGVRWMISEKIGYMGGKVFTGNTIREICTVNRIEFPFDVAKFDALLKKAGVYAGPTVKVDGRTSKVYTVDPEMIDQPIERWREEYKITTQEAI